jgi:hypothetical protein
MSYESMALEVLVSQSLTCGRLPRRRRAALRNALQSLRRPLTELEEQAMKVAGIDPAELDK